MKLTPLQQDIYAGKICPYCNSSTHITSEQEIYKTNYKHRQIIACINWPRCNSYVGTHEDGTAMGRLAGPELRKMKSRAHQAFDKIWKEGYRKRRELYGELADYLGLPEEYTHIGMFSVATCQKVINWANEYYELLKTMKNGS